MNILLSILLLVCVCLNVFLTVKLNQLLKELHANSVPEVKDSKPKEKATADDKATVAEQRYIDGIQNVLSYDVNIAKEYLRGAEKD